MRTARCAEKVQVMQTAKGTQHNISVKLCTSQLAFVHVLILYLCFVVML